MLPGLQRGVKARSSSCAALAGPAAEERTHCAPSRRHGTWQDRARVSPCHPACNVASCTRADLRAWRRASLAGARPPDAGDGSDSAAVRHRLRAAAPAAVAGPEVVEQAQTASASPRNCCGARPPTPGARTSSAPSRAWPRNRLATLPVNPRVGKPPRAPQGRGACPAPAPAPPARSIRSAGPTAEATRVEPHEQRRADDGPAALGQRPASLSSARCPACRSARPAQPQAP